MSAKLSQGLDPAVLDQVIRDLGVRVRLYKSTLCPNLKSLESMDHDINCTVCNKNMIDFSCKETLAMFQQQSLTEIFKVQGTFHIDELIATFLSGETLASFAKVELLDFKEDFYELVQRQEGTNVDRLKYAACTTLMVFVVRANVRIDFHQGADYELTANGDVKWVNAAHKPNDREIYSIYYKHHPAFRAVKAVHRDRYSQWNTRPQDIKSEHVTIGESTYVKLPETWILKRDYLVERRDADGNLLPGNTYYDPNES